LFVLGAPAAARMADVRPEKPPAAGVEAVRFTVHRSAYCPAIVRSGQAGARARKIVSHTVIGTVIQTRTGAGFTALTSRPGGRIILSGRNEPSLIGKSKGAVTHLKTTSAAERPAVIPEL